MAWTAARPDQFEVTDKGVTHKPTGCTFTPYRSGARTGNMTLGQLGNKLAFGEQFRPSEVQAMMLQLWENYCAKKE